VAYFDILILAGLAAFIIWRLHGVLGRREGHEQPMKPRSADQFGRSDEGASANGDNVVPLPGAASRDANAPEDFSKIAPAGSDLAQGLTEVQLADRGFRADGFLEGARGAYEMIVTAFAGADRRALKPLLSDEVYGDFDSALHNREAEGQRVETTFIGIEDARITGAGMRGKMAELTIRFVSELISLTKNSDGIVIEGDPTTVRKVIDIWTFSRDTSSGNPNWLLIATEEG